MPWREPAFPGEFPTLGYQVADWIEDLCVIPDGEHAGEPFLLTDEMVRFLVWHYRLKPAAHPEHWKRAWVHRRSQLVRPQKWGKGPFSSAIICAEADELDAPVLFDGWDADGEPVGRPWVTPWVQVTAYSEDQTDNVWRALVPMIELGPLADRIPDTGQTRINLAGGGFIEPVTASAKSRLGQRITFAVHDETHSWLKTNGMEELADNQRRNLAGMGGRSVETTNGWNPAESSVAQLTDESPVEDIFRDRTIPPEGSFTNKRDRRRILKAVYGDSWWVDLEVIEAEVLELIGKGELAQAERFFGNRIVVSEDSWIDPALWDANARPDLELKAGDVITIGFDGSKFDDATALHACRLEDGFIAELGIWEKPDGPAGDDWEVPDDEVDATVTEAFELYRVVLMYADPPYWQDWVSAWAGRYGGKIVKEWWTNRDRSMAAAIERITTAIKGHELPHDGKQTTRRHVANARRRKVTHGYTIRKDRPRSPHKIDGAMSATLAYEARADAIAANLRPKRRGGGAA